MSEDNGVDRQLKAQVLLSRKKSMGMALLLTLLFGPLGMFYSTVLGGVVMIVLTLVVGLPTMGLGLLLTWPIGLIWTAIAVKNQNDAIDQQALAA